MSAMKNAQWANRTYKQGKEEVLNRLSKALKDAEQLFDGSGFRLDFSNGYSQSFIRVAFSEHVLIRMLQASNFESID